MDLAEALIRASLNDAVNKYGIEGTEDKIKELYKLMPVCRDKMLEVFYATYGVRKDKNKSQGQN